MTEMDIREILDILPHRYPMLMVDKIVEADDEDRVVGLKNVTYNEPHLQGHFPGSPLMPGVLQIEAMAQVGGILLFRKTGERGRVPLLMAVDKARFRRRVYPGEQLRIEVGIIGGRSSVTRIRGRILVEQEVASEAELLFMLSDEEVTT